MIAGKARLIGVCWLACAAIPLPAQDCHLALRGKIVEAETGEPLAFATVVVEGAKRGTVSDEYGAFVIPDLCEGTTYTVTVNHVECEHQTQIIRLTRKRRAEFLLHHHQLKEVLVTEKPWRRRRHKRPWPSMRPTWLPGKG
ncbi:MAG: carboxypeptidase-like regulatory domain-containing protein [Saprospirales bacterium]|nr:carboxypeptidase-like regulatory domain-containing protein [Saprospirales bacterium]